MVDDLHPAQVVIHGVILVLDQAHTAGRYHHAALRDVHGVEVDHIAAGALVGALQLEAVEFRQVLRAGLGTVVQLLENDAVEHGFRLPDKRLAQGGAEGFQHGEEDPTVLSVDRATERGGAVNEVEGAVGVRRQLLIEPVEGQHLHKQFVLDGITRNEIAVDAVRRVVVQQVEAEVLAVHLEGT